MTNEEAIERISDHMEIHKIGEYPRALRPPAHRGSLGGDGEEDKRWKE